MYSSLSIAYAFVLKGIEDDNPVTQMKLQKLVYFAQGIHLAQYDEPLVKEKFQVWEYGPVIPQLYQIYRMYGSDYIYDTELLFLFNQNIEKKLKSDYKELNTKALNSIDITWNALKDINAITLSAWTHQEGAPWALHNRNEEIPNDEIKNYFRNKFYKNSLETSEN